MQQYILHFKTAGRGALEITDEIAELVTQSRFNIGLCHLFIHHTSAALMLCENADPLVRKDLETFMSRLVRDGDPLFEHDAEGKDDMSAHIRTILTHSDLTIPITKNKLAVGTWQGIYLWEHRLAPQHRKITVTLMGEYQ